MSFVQGNVTLFIKAKQNMNMTKNLNSDLCFGSII